nr:hypothetical protein [Alysiella crassa]UOP07868.1 hypothetical protein LVJ80_05920 [Alysiella crassa]
MVVVLAVLLNMLDGFDVLAVAFTAKSIKAELGLSGAQIGTLMSAGLLGMAAGSLLLGELWRINLVAALWCCFLRLCRRWACC